MDSSSTKVVISFEIVFIIDVAGAHQKPHSEADYQDPTNCVVR